MNSTDIRLILRPCHTILCIVYQRMKNIAHISRWKTLTYAIGVR
jgi:hypothetical protein